MVDTTQSMQETRNVNIESLKRIAIFMEGVKQGRGGNINPLGTIDLEELWSVIKYLQGDLRYTCAEFDKYYNVKRKGRDL